MFDFLQEIVSKVPDIGPESYHDERNPGRRRYVVFKFHLFVRVGVVTAHVTLFVVSDPVVACAVLVDSGLELF